MSDDYPEIPASLPSVTPRERPVLYLPDGREVQIRKPMGFAGHPLVKEVNRER